MAYSADAALATNATFINQVQMSMVKAAVNIAAEARTVRNTVDQKRNALSVRVLNSPTQMVTQFVYAAIEAGALVSGATDAQVDTAVASVWNGIAGVTLQDLA